MQEVSFIGHFLDSRNCPGKKVRELSILQTKEHTQMGKAQIKTQPFKEQRQEGAGRA